MSEPELNIEEPLTPEKWLELIETLSREELIAALKRQHPGDIAALLEQVPNYFQIHLFDLLDDEQAADVLPELDEPDQSRLIEQLPDQRVSAIAANLSTDEATDLLSQLDTEQAQDILEQLPQPLQQQVAELLNYEEDSAGGIMAKEAVSAPLSASVGEVIDLLRKSPWKDEELYNIYLVDEKGMLEGSVSIKDLVLALPTQPVADIVNDELVKIPLGMDQEEIAEQFRRYDLVSAPVVDEQGRFVGRITHDDILDIYAEEAEEDYARLTGQEEIDPSERSLFRNMRYRLPWLMLGMIGSLISATVIAKYEISISKLTALVFFLPLIGATGGNTGIQASSVMVRGLATGEISFFGMGQRIFREMGIALLIGLLLSSVIFLLSWVWQKDLLLALVVAVSLQSVVLFATIMGTFVPLTLKKFGLDPALATGPFITLTNDIMGVLVYLCIASAVLF